MFSNYLLVALRAMKRHKVYTAINIVGLAVGLACVMIIVHLVLFHFSFDKFHANYDRLYRIAFDIEFESEEPFGHGGAFGPTGPDFKDKFPEVEGYARCYKKYTKFTVQYGDMAVDFWNLLYSEPSFFDLFSFPFVAGDPANALTDPHSAVLTEWSARRCFGDENPVGKTIVMNGTDSLTVTGVIKDIPLNSHIQFDILVPLQLAWSNDLLMSYDTFPDFHTYLLLSPGTDPHPLEEKGQRYVDEYYPEVAGYLRLMLQPISDIHLHSGYLRYDLNQYKSDITLEYVFSAVAFLILLIACINYINLTTARTSGRDREVGIRKVLGANRSQLVIQFLWESVLMCLFGVLLASVILGVAWPILGTVFGEVIYLGRIDIWILAAIAAGLIVIVGILAGLYPAMFFSRPQPQQLIRGDSHRAIKGIGLRRLLVVVQFTVSIILIVSSILIGKQLRWVMGMDLGYDKKNVVIVPLTDTIRAQMNAFTRDLRALPGVLKTVENGYNPLSHGLRGTIFRKEKDSDTYDLTTAVSFGYGFVDFYGMEIVEGRDFDPATDDSASVCLVNETMIRRLGGGSGIGRTIWILGDKGPGQEMGEEKSYRIIGVLKDFYYQQLQQQMQPIVVFIDPEQYRNLAVKIGPEDQDATIDSIKEIWLRYDPAGAFNTYFMARELNQLYQSEEQSERMVVFFSMMAIILASLGLFGLISFSVERRIKEIGIRKVLGASVTDIVLLLVREFAILLGIANVFAWPVAWYIVNRWISRFAYHVDVGWGPFLLGGLIAVVIAALTIGREAFEAATANPVKALRYE